MGGSLFFVNNCIEVKLIYKEMYTLNAHNLVNLGIGKHPWHCHNNQGNRHILHLSECPCVPVCMLKNT